MLLTWPCVNDLIPAIVMCNCTINYYRRRESESDPNCMNISLIIGWFGSKPWYVGLVHMCEWWRGRYVGAREYTVSSTLSHRETSREGAWGKCHYVERSYDWRGKKDTGVIFGWQMPYAACWGSTVGDLSKVSVVAMRKVTGPGNLF